MCVRTCQLSGNFPLKLLIISKCNAATHRHLPHWDPPSHRRRNTHSKDTHNTLFIHSFRNAHAAHAQKQTTNCDKQLCQCAVSLHSFNPVVTLLHSFVMSRTCCCPSTQGPYVEANQMHLPPRQKKKTELTWNFLWKYWKIWLTGQVI